MSIIRGYVEKRKTGVRVPNCAIDIYHIGEEEPYRESHTNFNGEFEFDVPPGKYVIMFTGPFFTPIKQNVEIGEDEEKTYKLVTEFIGLGVEPATSAPIE